MIFLSSREFHDKWTHHLVPSSQHPEKEKTRTKHVPHDTHQPVTVFSKILVMQKINLFLFLSGKVYRSNKVYICQIFHQTIFSCNYHNQTLCFVQISSSPGPLIIKAKLSDYITILEKLHEKIPRELLPKELGSHQ